MEEVKKENEQEVGHEVMHEHSSPKSSFTEKIRKNPWTLSTLVLGILIAILLIGTFSGNISGNVISSNKAASNLVSYLDANVDPSITLINVTEELGLYLVNVDYQGQTVPVYVTKDGSSFTTVLTPMIVSDTYSNTNTNTKTTEVPKSEKPKVELYVFTYCPYGLQMEKAMLPAVSLLGNNIDFKIRQIGAMHGDFEKVEAIRQLSIEALYPDKYLAYVLAFAEDTACSTGDATCVATKVGAIYTKLGMDASKINAYMASSGEALYNTEVSNAKANGVSGSPTLIINGVVSQASRSPEGVKGAICSAFNTVPSLCSQNLSTSQASAGFGSGTGSDASSAAACG